MALLVRKLLKQNIKPYLITKNIFHPFSTIVKQSNNVLEQSPHYMDLNNDWTVEHSDKVENLLKDMTVHENFLSESEEQHLFNELEPYLKRMRYEFDHWDDAIHGFRETERLQWNKENVKTIDRIRELAFSKTISQLRHVHVLDLAPKGFIKPHIDAVRFCGNTIAGVSLLSDCIMRLVHDKHKNLYADFLLKRRSLYVMKDSARYDYTHEILKEDVSIFKEEKVSRDRRISIICRNEPR